MSLKKFSSQKIKLVYSDSIEEVKKGKITLRYPTIRVPNYYHVACKYGKIIIPVLFIDQGILHCRCGYAKLGDNK